MLAKCLFSMIEICICKSRKFIYSENTVTGIVIAWAQWHPQLKVHMLFVQKQGGGAVLTLKNVWIFFFFVLGHCVAVIEILVLS